MCLQQLHFVEPLFFPWLFEASIVGFLWIFCYLGNSGNHLLVEVEAFCCVLRGFAPSKRYVRGEKRESKKKRKHHGEKRDVFFRKGAQQPCNIFVEKQIESADQKSSATFLVLILPAAFTSPFFPSLSKQHLFSQTLSCAWSSSKKMENRTILPPPIRRKDARGQMETVCVEKRLKITQNVT